jgi:hypothetical protein
LNCSIKKDAEIRPAKKDSGIDYLKWGIGGACVFSVPGWIIAYLYRMGPEFVRGPEPKDLVPLIILISIGFLVGCGLKLVL